jgi:hypothetical protein
LAPQIPGVAYGRVAPSRCPSQAIAWSRESPHISGDGANPAQQAGRCGRPKMAQA